MHGGRWQQSVVVLPKYLTIVSVRDKQAPSLPFKSGRIILPSCEYSFKGGACSAFYGKTSGLGSLQTITKRVAARAKMHVRRARSNKQKSNQIHFNFCSRRWLTLHQRKQDALSLRFHHVIVGSGNFAGWRASECVLPITATCAFPGRPAQITRASQQRMLGCITFLLTRFFYSLPPALWKRAAFQWQIE